MNQKSLLLASGIIIAVIVIGSMAYFVLDLNKSKEDPILFTTSTDGLVKLYSNATHLKYWAYKPSINIKIESNQDINLLKKY